jgi:putative ABC transport system substrate-binding protein
VNRREFITLASGAAMAHPLVARAQQTERVRRVAILIGTVENDPTIRSWIQAFEIGLEALGWSQGRNVLFERRSAAGDASRAQQFARELVRVNPDVFFTTSTPTAAAILRETQSIPIVFTNISDPLGSGLVPSLARPGGNITGFTNFEFGIGGKWLEIMRELVPTTKRAALLFHPEAATYSAGYIRSFEAAAPSFSIEPIVKPIRTIIELENTISAQASEPGGSAIILPDIFTVANRLAIIALMGRHRLPAAYPFGAMAREGGLVAYGPDIADLYRRAAAYVDRILKGEKSGDLPVQQPTKFEFVVNVKTAKALGLTVPPMLLVRADEVIE